MKPHRCPVCDGEGKVSLDPNGPPCPACHGTCVVWEPDAGIVSVPLSDDPALTIPVGERPDRIVIHWPADAIKATAQSPEHFAAWSQPMTRPHEPAPPCPLPVVHPET